MTIKVIKNGNNSLGYCPERGGLITSLNIHGKEILYFDQSTFEDKNLSVRGGIPILFPNAGLLKDNSIFPNLKQHGFARNCLWNTVAENDNTFTESLKSNNETYSVYPFNFVLSVKGELLDENIFKINLEVESHEKTENLPIALGLHPYFYVPNEKKKDIEFLFEGGEIVKENFETWVNGGTLVIDNPQLKNSEIKINIPDIGNIKLDIPPEFKKIWIWSQPGKDFICIEPMMRDLNGILDNPQLIKPLSKFKTHFGITLEL